ncbi:hypothetical protein Poli38472_013583 [Pythium oligandrum]|uniref:Nickel/cobalt efflux system n=1 Tax=Pythium oligandrum TaxID=41045 RepID=A0A8K1CDF4_PYTOL|nr:hypothetical protein Poli38472_013583 [Pythium oligandrum]|eukprot:TMW61120.1 hypothetical protein Poli38472_013583 [Pythium oligandrum]
MTHASSGSAAASGGDASSLMEHASLPQIILTGLSLGILHVITGPDHLSALAALSSGHSWMAFALGVQWGCGHSLGILVIAAICLALGHSLDIGVFRHVCNYIVGVFLISIGAWTLRVAYVQYERQSRPPSKWSSVQCQDATYVLLPDEADTKAERMDTTASYQGLVSVCIGLLHGVAGPGGVLGVLPAVAMRHIGSSIVYLACFCVSSILCMGAFAALYGEITRRSSLQSSLIAFRIALLSSTLSIVVGVVWITLQACGVLEHVFGHKH